MAAKKVADYIGTVHHEINYTIEEGLDAIRDVIYYIETYDVTTVRASHSDVPVGARNQVDGYKDGVERRRADEVFGVTSISTKPRMRKHSTKRPSVN